MPDREWEPVQQIERVAMALIVSAGVAYCVQAGWRAESWTVASYATNTTDSLLFRVVGEMLLSGELPYDDAARAAWISETRLQGADPPFGLPFAYPPSALPLFALRGIGPASVNFALTVGFGALAFLMAAVWLAEKTLPIRLHRLVAVFTAAMMPVAMFDGLLGQTGHLVGTLAIGALSGPIVSGVCVGLLMFKPQYGVALAVVLAARGERKAIGIAIGVATCVLLVGTAGFGMSAWPEFVAAAARPNHTVPYMANWMSTAAAAGAPLSLLNGLSLPVFAAGLIGIGGAARLIPDRNLALAAAISVVWVLSPNTHPYDLCMVFVPVVIVAAQTVESKTLLVLVGAHLVLALPLLTGQRWEFSLVGIGMLTAVIVASRGFTGSDPT